MIHYVSDSEFYVEEDTYGSTGQKTSLTLTTELQLLPKTTSQYSNRRLSLYCTAPTTKIYTTVLYCTYNTVQ